MAIESPTHRAHAILGVGPRCDSSTLKQAYRRRVRELHPDRQRDTSRSQRFRELRAAYEALQREIDAKISSSQEHDEEQAHGPPVLSGLVELEFQEALFGGERVVVVRTAGFEGSLRVVVPPGTADGDHLRHARGVPFSLEDHVLDVHARVAPHPDWRLEGRDVHVEVPIPLATAYLGGQVRVEGPWGPVDVPVMAGDWQSELRVVGHGVRVPGHASGDLCVQLRMALPQQVSQELRLALMWAAPRTERCAWLPGVVARRELARHFIADGRTRALVIVEARGGHFHGRLTWPATYAMRDAEVELRVQDIERPNDARDFEIRVPANLRAGQVLRLAGAHRGQDVHLEVDVHEHGPMRRVGDDLEIDLPVDVIDAYDGGSIEVPTPDGMRELQLPPGSQHDDRIRIVGAGWPSAAGGHGDLVLRIEPVLPPAGDAHLGLMARRHASSLEDCRVRARTSRQRLGAEVARPAWRLDDLAKTVAHGQIAERRARKAAESEQAEAIEPEPIRRAA